MSEPLFDCPRASGSFKFSAVALSFQFSDSGGDVGFGFAFDVAAVGFAVVEDADGDASVPLAVFPEAGTNSATNDPQLPAGAALPQALSGADRWKASTRKAPRHRGLACPLGRRDAVLAGANVLRWEVECAGSTIWRMSICYLLLHAPALALLHAGLLGAYRAGGDRDQWWCLPAEEPYIWDHLIEHL